MPLEIPKDTNIAQNVLRVAETEGSNASKPMQVRSEGYKLRLIPLITTLRVYGCLTESPFRLSFFQPKPF